MYQLSIAVRVVHTMGEAQFYITLPSNSSVNVYPENTVSNYITKLPQEVNLNGEWEVGLAEMQYPRTWINVREGQHWIYFRGGAHEMVNADKIPIGYYDTVQDLIDEIHQALERLSTQAALNIRLSYEKIANRVKFTIKNGASILVMDDVATMLGLELPIPAPINSSLTAPYAPNLRLGMHSLFVYCDLVHAQMVGDAQVPLLRIVPVQGQHGEYVTRTYQSPQYLPVSRKTFESIEIDIKDDTGRNVPFESGKSVVTLHFRLKRSPYFN